MDQPAEGDGSVNNEDVAIYAEGCREVTLD